MGHNRAGDNRKRRLRRCKAEAMRLRGGKDHSWEYAPIFSENRPGTVQFFPLRDIKIVPGGFPGACPSPPSRLMRELRESILQHGVAPLLILANGQLVAGERRYKACRAIGYAKVPVRIVKGDMKEALRLAFNENVRYLGE